jgi:hypothetical protein
MLSMQAVATHWGELSLCEQKILRSSYPSRPKASHWPRPAPRKRPADAARSTPPARPSAWRPATKASGAAPSSYALDAGQFRWLASTDPDNKSYTPLTLEDPAFYVPLLRRTAYPRWFVTYLAANGENRGAHGPGYIVFTQQAPGQAWLDVLEPYAIPGAGPAPKVTLDASGYATAVTPQAAGLAAQPAALPAMTAAALTGTSKAIAVPGTLTDQGDAAFWRKTLPADSSVSETHSPAAGTVYALRTTGGGALVLFAGTTALRLTPPPGLTFDVVVPGAVRSQARAPKRQPDARGKSQGHREVPGLLGHPGNLPLMTMRREIPASPRRAERRSSHRAVP